MHDVRVEARPSSRSGRAPILGLFASDLEIALVLADSVEPAARVLGARLDHHVPIMRHRRSAGDHLPELAALGAGWYTTKEAAKSLGLSQWAVWNAIVIGELVATQARSRGQRSFWYVHAADLDRYRAIIAPPTLDHINLLAAPAATGIRASTLKSWRRWRGLRVIDRGLGNKVRYVDLREIERLRAIPSRKGGRPTKSERLAA